LQINQLLFWGTFGLIVEIFFTAIVDLFSKRDFNLKGHTSLWMFPIYSLGLTYGFDVIQQIIPNDFIRYLSYPLWIWLIEILVGYPASKIGIRIWDYRYLSNNKHWKGIISFIHFPIWIIFGILVELVDILFNGIV
tara:strand:- start:277 stop:684 length:408 start_codon:yes stop_codon:yes gene_type:complete